MMSRQPQRRNGSLPAIPTGRKYRWAAVKLTRDAVAVLSSIRASNG